MGLASKTVAGLLLWLYCKLSNITHPCAAHFPQPLSHPCSQGVVPAVAQCNRTQKCFKVEGWECHVSRTHRSQGGRPPSGFRPRTEWSDVKQPPPLGPTAQCRGCLGRVGGGPRHNHWAVCKSPCHKGPSHLGKRGLLSEEARGGEQGLLELGRGEDPQLGCPHTDGASTQLLKELDCH